MTLISLLWRLGRRRWVRRMLLWLLARLVRLFGWRRVVRIVVRGSGGGRRLAATAWRAAIIRLGLGRVILALLAWTRTRVLRRLGVGPVRARHPGDVARRLARG